MASTQEESTRQTTYTGTTVFAEDGDLGEGPAASEDTQDHAPFREGPGPSVSVAFATSQVFTGGACDLSFYSLGGALRRHLVQFQSPFGYRWLRCSCEIVLYYAALVMIPVFSFTMY